MELNTKTVNPINPFNEIAFDIKLIVMDVDGVMTDGGIYICDNGMSFRKFNVQDGIGIRLLQNCGCEIAIISGGDAEIAVSRAQALNIKYVFTKILNKKQVLIDLQDELSIKAKETIYLGDDVNDISVIHSVALFLSPKDAHQACLDRANWVGNSKGGDGFVREFADLFCLARNIDPCQVFENRNT